MPALLPNPMVNFQAQTPGHTHISPYAKIDEVVQLKNHNMTKRSLGNIVKVVSGIVKGASKIDEVVQLKNHNMTKRSLMVLAQS